MCRGVLHFHALVRNGCQLNPGQKYLSNTFQRAPAWSCEEWAYGLEATYSTGLQGLEGSGFEKSDGHTNVVENPETRIL